MADTVTKFNDSANVATGAGALAAPARQGDAGGNGFSFVSSNVEFA